MLAKQAPTGSPETKTGVTKVLEPARITAGWNCVTLLKMRSSRLNCVTALLSIFPLGVGVLWAQAPAPPQAILPPPPTNAGCIIQSDFGSGSHHNFETLVLEGSKLVHYWHDNADVNYTWRRGQVISRQATGYGCLIQSDFKSGSHGNFEVVVPEGSQLVHYWHDNSNTALPWQRGGVISSQSTGPAGIIQSDFKSGSHGNFEVVALEGRTLAHYWHDNSNVNNPWQRGGTISAVASGPASIIQSDFKSGEHGNFELVAPEGNNLVHYFHDNSNVNNPWQRGQTVTQGVTGPASLIQSNFGSGGHGNFELLVPQGGNLVHWYHDNSNVNNPWQRGQTVLAGIAGYASLIQSNFGSTNHGNFEAVAFHGGQVFHHFHDNSNVNNPWQAGQQITVQSRSQKICQLTGEYDYGNEHNAFNATGSRYQLQGTDLGYPFEHAGRVYFSFGDSGDNGIDSIAYTRDLTAENCLHLDFVADGNQFKPITIYDAATNSNLSMGYFEVPTTGFSANGNLYLFAWTDHRALPGSNPKAVCGPNLFTNQVGHAALARSKDNGISYQAVFQDLGEHFVYLSTAVVDAASIAGLPVSAGQGLLIWGTGACYRQSNVGLAFVPLNQVEDKNAIRYLTGVGANGVPVWGTLEQISASGPIHQANAGPHYLLTGEHSNCLGELSVTWNSNLNEWLMLYNCNEGKPNGQVLARAAAHPWGPWSDAAVLFDPHTDYGFSYFIHCQPNSPPTETCNAVNDNLNDGNSPGQPGAGDVYAPYIIPRYTEGGLHATTIYFTMSTWNPYDVVLMRATLAVGGIYPYGHDTCKNGFVWREAAPDDHVCVTPAVHASTQQENAQADARRVPNSGTASQDLCISGFVWRGAFDDDRVCVTPQSRTQATADNAAASSRRASSLDVPLKPGPPLKKKALE